MDPMDRADPRFEATPELAQEVIRQSIADGTGESFARALRSAALYWSVAAFDELIALAAHQARDGYEYWAIAEAIHVMVQARQQVPPHAESILAGMPDTDVSDISRDDALSLIRQVRERDD